MEPQSPDPGPHVLSVRLRQLVHWLVIIYAGALFMPVTLVEIKTAHTALRDHWDRLAVDARGHA